MEGGGAKDGSAAAAQTRGSGDDGSHKPLPPCCLKAKAAAAESEAKCHATVVSGWFTEPRSHSGKTSKVQYFNNPMWPGISLVLFPVLFHQDWSQFKFIMIFLKQYLY
jgi:spermidine synthase